MNLIELTDGVYTADEQVITCDEQILPFLREQCLSAPKRRARFCAHSNNNRQVHEMIIALADDSYIRPHRHLDKSESFHVIEGTADVILFDDSGLVQRVIPMSPAQTGHAFYYRIESPIFHTVVVTSETFVFHETTPGPFRQDASEYAAWAPDEQDRKAGLDFLRQRKMLFQSVGATQ